MWAGARAHSCIQPVPFVFGSVFPLFLADLGLDKARIGLALALLIPYATLISPIMAPFVSKWGFRRTFLTVWTIRKFIIAAMLLAPAILATAGLDAAFAWITACIIGFALCRATGDTGLLPWTQELVPNDIRGKFLAFENLVGTLGQIAVVALAGFLIDRSAAFSLSRLKPAGSRIVLFLFLSTLMVPSMAYLIPAYLTVVSLPIVNIPLIDTWWGVWLPGAASAFNIFVLKSFFDEIPQDLIDAANIDGAGAARTLAQIVLPLSRPVLAVVSIFTLIGAWKDFFWPFLVLSKVELQPIMVALWRLSARMQEPLNLIIAGLAIASTPPIILFLIFQKQIIRGITLTGLKG